MVVEDEPIIRAVVVDALYDAAVASLQADSADDAIMHLQSGARIDLLFTDVKMPGVIDGIGLAQLVTSQFSGMPVIVTSANSTAYNLPQSICFIPKPYQIKVLVARICATLDCTV